MNFETKKVELAGAEALKKLENEAESVQLDYDYKKEGMKLTHDYQKEKLTRTADLYDKSMDAMQLHMKQEHEARMEDIKAQSELMMKSLGGAKTLSYKRRTGGTQYLNALHNESRLAGRNLALAAPPTINAIGHDEKLAITDNSKFKHHISYFLL